MLSMTATSILSIRPAEPTEDSVLRDLSELDATPQLQRPALLALVDDQPAAPAPPSAGRAAPDPGPLPAGRWAPDTSPRTKDGVGMLRAHVDSLRKAA